MGDWLGTGTIAPRLREYRSFKEARAFVRSLGLKSEAEWRAYCKSGKKPDDIPSYSEADYTRRMAGLEWATGSGRARSRPLTQVSTVQGSPRFRAQPRFEIWSRMARL